MLNNEEIVRELYAAAEGSGKDIAKFVSFFSDEGYMCDIPKNVESLVGIVIALDMHGGIAPRIFNIPEIGEDLRVFCVFCY
jgi:hypothetical protein